LTPGRVPADSDSVAGDRYSIVATLGPATDSDELIRRLRAAGADAFRLNTSHLDLQAVEKWLARLTRLWPSPDAEVPIVLDLQGSKWRLGSFPPFRLREGAIVELVQAPESTVADELPVPHEDFFAAAPDSSSELRLDDARCLLQVEACEANRLRARVIRGGVIKQRKGVTFERSAFRHESLGNKDRTIIEAVIERALPPGSYPRRIALSYVRDATEMRTYRRLLGPSAYLIAKLERDTAVQEAGGIASFADELWLCRGDLGAELGLRRMAEVLHDFSLSVPDLPVPVLLAGQVFGHMTGSPDPTRAEICALYESLRQGYRGVVLSDETAIGCYPVESCQAAATFL
jgi:pyruvate kinase